ncbi:ABC transporter permease [Aggregicoccus sp. 17bor-14]|uniref:putative ABC exporter domain-containing protein n=1 Tax=Myxococcaceae TaxID=31 RepID=UPI00129C702A|nr:MULTISPECIES: putative ABC exporter domain-containing protein [Myxococcaceae]MBF5046348.1 ABC transporter permease [Simulacricoccus sp. 17bor-14]MRI92068.1 ABC transporter permease [Aggregicoccus sp. 17bor-14]
MSFARAVAFLWLSSARNRVRRQLRRLAQPKYLAGAVVGLAYFYSVFLQRLHLGGGGRGGPPYGARLVLEVLLCGGALLTVLGAWSLGADRPQLTFTEAEVQLLFPAPVSRRALVRYRAARGLLRAALSALLTTLFFGRSMASHAGFFAVGSFLSLGTLQLHVAAASLVRTRLAERGRAWLRWVGVALVVGALALALLLALRGQPLPGPGMRSWQVQAWGEAVLGSRPLHWALAPFRALVAPALAVDLRHFVRALPWALGLLLAHGVWLERLEVPFEEAAVGAADARARGLGTRGLRRQRVTLKPVPFRLAPTGRPEVALLWKNLVAGRRLGALSFLGVTLALGAVLAGLLVGSAGGAFGGRLVFVAAVCVGLAGFLAVLGPGSLRVDLRMDLPKLELLRALPLRGSQVVAGELLAPGLLLALLQALLLVLGFALSSREPVPGLPLPLRAAATLGLLPLLPAISLAGLLVQNVAVVLFPSWLPTAAAGQVEPARGIEVFGQRLLMLAGTLLVLALGLVPASLLALLLGWGLQGLLGPWALVPAGAAAAALLLGEVALGVLLLGRAFDRLDVSGEALGE